MYYDNTLINMMIYVQTKCKTYYVLYRLSLITWAASRKKVPNALSHCHTKRRTEARGHAHPSFGRTLTF